MAALFILPDNLCTNKRYFAVLECVAKPDELDIQVCSMIIPLLNGVNATKVRWKTGFSDKKFIHTDNYNVLTGNFFILLHLGR